MKRSEEERIMQNSLSSCGVELSPKITQALSDGLKAIRCARYAERCEAKRKYKENKSKWHKMKYPNIEAERAKMGIT